MTQEVDQNRPNRGRVESPASRYGEPERTPHAEAPKTAQTQPNPSPKDKMDEALEAFLNHPFWAKLPKALHGLKKHIATTEFSKPIFERLIMAMSEVTDRGWVIGQLEQAFLAAARTEFGENKGFLTGTAVNFLHTIERLVDSSEAVTSLQKLEREQADLAHFIFRAAHEKPELLDHLNDSLYKNLDSSVLNNPHLDKLLDELLVHGGLQTLKEVQALKLMLSKLRAKWTEDRCETARKSFVENNYLIDFDLAKLQSYVWMSRDIYSSVSTKLIPVAQALCVSYSEEKVLRLEAICYILHTARLTHHA